jgi:glutathione S-transferase
MKLYGTPPTRAVRPIWVLNELRLDCEIVPIDLMGGAHLGPEFLAINPFGKVPVLVDGDLVIAESVAIALYLAERYGDGRLAPANPSERAEMTMWSLFLATEIEQPLWRIALHTAIYPEAERVAADVPLARRDCRRMLAPLEERLAERDWLVGGRMSTVDLLAAYTLDWADEAELLQDMPALQRFVERMYARENAPPTIKEAFAVLADGRTPGRYRHLR